MSAITVLGSGGWGIALACALDQRGHSVSLWSKFEEEVSLLQRERCNSKLLPGVTIPETVGITGDIRVAAASELVVMAVPSFATRSTAQLLRGVLKDGTYVVNVGKGFERDTLKCLSTVIEEELPAARVVVLSGPSHAEEVARGVPTSLVAASRDLSAAEWVQDAVFTPRIRVYTNDDVLGIEIGGALKNVIALCAGICDGLQLGDNTKAAMMTRGLSEIARLGVKMGAREETFMGLTGVGDLIVTCMSMHSRNRRFGILIGQGVAPKEALEQIGMTVEGYHACAIAQELAKKYGVDMPIVQECYNILYDSTPPSQAIDNLMLRPRKHERETSWL